MQVISDESSVVTCRPTSPADDTAVLHRGMTEQRPRSEAVVGGASQSEPAYDDLGGSMRLGINFGYQDWGTRPRRAPSRSRRRPTGSASTRSGPPRPTAPTRSRRSPGSWRTPSGSTSAPRSCRCRPARPAMTAMTAATLDLMSGGRFLLGLGLSGPAGGRGLARSAVRQAARQDPRVRRHRAHDPAPRGAARAPRPALRHPLLAVPTRPASASRSRSSCTRAAPTSRSTSPRSVRRTSSCARRSPTAGSRSSSPPTASARPTAPRSTPGSRRPAAARASPTSTSRRPSR